MSAELISVHSDQHEPAYLIKLPSPSPHQLVENVERIFFFCYLESESERIYEVTQLEILLKTGTAEICQADIYPDQGEPVKEIIPELTPISTDICSSQMKTPSYISPEPDSLHFQRRAFCPASERNRKQAQFLLYKTNIHLYSVEGSLCVSPNYFDCQLPYQSLEVTSYL